MHSVVFNTLTRKFFEVQSRFIEDYKLVISDPQSAQNCTSLRPFLEKLKAERFIVPDDVNEVEELRKLYERYRNSAIYEMVIMTTYACNFSCWYCYQRHKNLSLTDTVISQIIKHINTKLNNADNEGIHISWFGGEPLLNIKAIDQISTIARRLSTKAAKPFTCSITTNGSLLNSQNVSILASLPLTSIQITLDGDKDSHNKTRSNHYISNSFDLILLNVVHLAEALPEVNVILRINYTAHNLELLSAESIDDFLHLVKRNITVMFRKVWQEPASNLMRRQVASLSRDFESKGYKVMQDFDDLGLLSCYVERNNYLSIYPDGSVDNCNNKPLSAARGHLDEDGNIVWMHAPAERLHTIFNSSSDCIKCHYLPLCMGPCPKRRENLTDNAHIDCIIDNKDAYFLAEVKDYCTYKINRN